MADNSIPLVSVIIPVFNGKGFIAKCLASLEKQDYSNYEIIIVDDGSTDGSADLVKAPARLIKTEGRKGAGAARNTGAREAKGKVLMFTDIDCIVPEQWISNTIMMMKEKDVLCGGGGYVGPAKEVFVEQFAFEELAYRRRKFHGYVNTLVSNNMYCDAELFAKEEGFPENYLAASSEDMEFSWKVSRNNKIWWDADNGVYHDFADTIKKYLKQQYRFAVDAVPMLLGNNNVVKGKTHHGKQLYIETAFTGFALFSLAMMNWLCAITFAALVAIVNLGFVGHLLQRRGLFFVIPSILVLYVRNVTIIAGVGAGMLKYIFGNKK